VVLPVRDVGQELAVDRDPDSRLAVDRVLRGDACRPRFERPPILAAERGEHRVRLLRPVELLVLDDAAEAADRVLESAVGVVPDLRVAVDRGAAAVLEVDQGPAPFPAEDDVQDRSVTDGCERTAENPVLLAPERPREDERGGGGDRRGE
jgi:hypothetical protein